MELLEKVGAVVGGIAIVALVGLLMCLPVMWLWNGLMPEIFGLIKITFWQSLGLIILCNFLFGGSKK
jgi:hypothetical protein